MAEAEVIIALRTFSGPNLGAEVMLPVGTYTIGTDYSCDIVLGDSSMAPRHAALTAEQSQPGQLPRVYLKPLDADILLEEDPIPAEGREMSPATPWFLGLTCLSWNTPNAPREAIIPRLGRPAHPADRLEQPSGQPGPTASGRIDVTPKTEPAASKIVAIEMPTPLPRKRRWPARLALFLVLLAAAFLVFEFTGVQDSTEEFAVKLREEIRQQGLDSVQVSSESDRLMVSGSVLDEKERALLWSLARNLKCPVYIRVGVREDMAQAVKMKLNSKGIFPEVTFPGGGKNLLVAAYIKDPQTENAAFASLSKDLPDLPLTERRIVHAVQLKSFIEKELHHAKLRNVNTALGTGRIDLTDTSSSGNHEALQRVMQRIEENLNIPLAYTIISQDSPRPDSSAGSQGAVPLVAGGIAPDMPASASGNSPLEGVQITGVTIGSMRFVSLANGQRIFEGGLLPGGHIVEMISLDSLTLSKNGRITTYPLRGNNE